ncbi:MAG: tRNA lysidine(34) synthetase TilS [Armatimonadetes bacterium]|nr:tRNA lysidine(34) synthetase TilS [Armatimonadota bacterium]
MDIGDKLRTAVSRYQLLAAGDRVLVAVSGGQDSVALATLLADLRQELQLDDLVIGHLHHGLRGAAADADQASVKALAERLGCGFVTERVDVAQLARERRVGIEVAGREARYAFLQRAAESHQCSKVALGHTATDRAETLLMNLMRGAGLRGLASIPPRRGIFVRPLILATRQDTADFCRSRGLRVCEDSSNSDVAYRRNRVRAELIPQLEAQYGPGVEAALCRAAEHAWQELEWTEPLVAETYQRCSVGGALRVAEVQALAPGLRLRVLRHFLQRAGFPVRDIGTERWEALSELVAGGETGKRVELARGLSVCLEYGLLKVGSSAPGPSWEQEITLSVPGRVSLPDGRSVVAEWVTGEVPEGGPAVGVLDADRAGPELQVRLCRPGDRFVPSGMRGRKKLQDYFVDAKVPRAQRRPLVVLARGEILWVVGHRLAETARPSETTRRFLVVRVVGERMRS